MTEDAEDGSAYIRGWLNLKMTTGRYSTGLVNQLVDHVNHRSANIFAIFDELGCLEGAPNTKLTRTKPAAQFTGKLLCSFWHKHYSQAPFIRKNVQNHWKKSGMLPAFIKSVMEDEAIPYEDKARRLAHGFAMDGYKERSQAGEMTGEWIVYAKHQNVNYYLTLGTHNEDQAILDRVRPCFSEFPELAAYLL